MIFSNEEHPAGRKHLFLLHPLALFTVFFLGVLSQADACCCGCCHTATVTNAPSVSTNSCAPLASAVTPGHTNRFDRAHHRVSGWVEYTAVGLDNFLTDVITDDDDSRNVVTNTVGPVAKPSTVTLSPGIGYSKYDDVQYRGRFRAHINLPSLKNRVQVIVNNVQEDEDVLTDVNDPISRERRVVGDNDKSAGLRFILVDRMDFDLSVGAGLRFKPDPVSKIKTRARIRTDGFGTLFELAETGFWESDNGLGEKTEFIMTHMLGKRFTLRSTSAALLQETHHEHLNGVVLGETVSGEYLIRPRRTVGVTVGVEWYTDPAAAVNSYSVRVPYRQGIWRDWMYLRVEPGADFANENDFDMNPLITVGFDILFGVTPNRSD